MFSCFDRYKLGHLIQISMLLMRMMLHTVVVFQVRFDEAHKSIGALYFLKYSCGGTTVKFASHFIDFPFKITRISHVS